MPVIAAVTFVRLKRRLNVYGYMRLRWRDAGGFEALVWDPTAVHLAMARTKRHPLAALLARQEKVTGEVGNV